MNDLDLAALVASKICHDALGPMTAIGFGMDVLDEDDDDEDQLDNAMMMIRKGVRAITAKVQFARLAFGAAGSSGLEIDMQEVRTVAGNYVEGDGKHRIEWHSDLASLPKNHVKLLLNLIAIAVGAIPAGGSLDIRVSGEKERPAMVIRAVGPRARIADGLVDLVRCSPQQEVDARSVQPYFAGRVARALEAEIVLEMQGEDAVLEARFS